MKKLLMIFALLTLGLSGCGDDDDDNNVTRPPNTGTGTGAGDGDGNNTTGGRNYTCTRAGTTNIAIFNISGDGNTIILTQAGGDPITFVRNDAPDDSDNEADSTIEYRRSGSTANPDEIKVSGPIVVSGAASGSLEIGNNTFTCQRAAQ